MAQRDREVGCRVRSGVSVVIPTYNRRETVVRAIASALTQTRPPLEVLVVDDGSTDGTSTYLRERYGDRIRVIVQENAGVAAARNRGLREARGDLVAFLDSDDTWAPRKLELQLSAMRDDGVVLCASNWRWADGDGRGRFEEIGCDRADEPTVLNEPLMRLARIKGHGLLIQSCLVRRDVMLDIGGFDPALRITEDVDVLFRMAEVGRFAILREVLVSRSRDLEGGHLTDERSTAWQVENSENTIAILRRTLRSLGPRSPACRHALRRRLVHLLMARAKIAARSGDIAAARTFAREAFRTPVLSRSMMVSFVCYAHPRAFVAK